MGSTCEVDKINTTLPFLMSWDFGAAVRYANVFVGVSVHAAVYVWAWVCLLVCACVYVWACVSACVCRFVCFIYVSVGLFIFVRVCERHTAVSSPDILPEAKQKPITYIAVLTPFLTRLHQTPHSRKRKGILLEPHSPSVPLEPCATRFPLYPHGARRDSVQGAMTGQWRRSRACG